MHVFTTCFEYIYTGMWHKIWRWGYNSHRCLLLMMISLGLPPPISMMLKSRAIGVSVVKIDDVFISWAVNNNPTTVVQAIQDPFHTSSSKMIEPSKVIPDSINCSTFRMYCQGARRECENASRPKSDPEDSNSAEISHNGEGDG